MDTIQRYQFDDFHAYAESIRDADLDCMLPSLQQADWQLTSFSLGDVHFQIGREGSGIICEGAGHEQLNGAFVPLSNEQSHSVNGVQLEKRGFAILEPGCDFYLGTLLPHHWCSVSFPHESFHRPDGIREERSECHIVGQDDLAGQRFSSLLIRFLKSVQLHPVILEAEASRRAVAQQLHAALSDWFAVKLAPSNQGSSENSVGRPRLSRQDLIERTMRLVETSEIEQAPSVEQIAATVGVSERTLRSVFRDCFHVSPKRFFQLKQLHRVRAQLKLPDEPKVRVSEILAENGVWEFSRFAKRYRELFGELPSHTLQASRNRLQRRA